MQQPMILTLLQFLKNSKLILTLPTPLGSSVNIVIGNQTADMDSSVGSILLAYILQCTQNDKYYVPLINTSQREFQSHFDVHHALDIMVEEVTYKDQVNIQKLNEVYNLQLILYDHNIPDGIWQSMKLQVVQIIDHHEDKTEGYYQQLVNKNIQKVGSAITLVSQLFNDEHLTNTIRKLICSTILIDTFNFDPKQKGIRWVDEDQHQYNRIQLSFEADKIYHFYNKLKYSKEMNLKLDFDSMLRKDYKEYKYTSGLAGYIVIFVSMDDMQQKYSQQELEQKLIEFKLQGNLQSLIVMFVHQDLDDILGREILILNENSTNLKLLEEEMIFTQKLNLKQIQLDFKQPYLYYQDVNAEYTRKTIEPIISKIF